MISIIDIFIKTMTNEEFFDFLDHCQTYEYVLYELLNEVHTGYEADCSDFDDIYNQGFYSSSDEDMYVDEF